MNDPFSELEKPAEFLIVDDNPGDVRLIEEMLKEVELAHSFHTVTTGAEALDFAFQRNNHVDAPTPDLILLDWRLVDMSGAEVLEELNADSDLCDIPVVVVTGSDALIDHARSYPVQAEAYLTKPVEPDEFFDVFRSIRGPE